MARLFTALKAAVPNSSRMRVRGPLPTRTNQTTRPCRVTSRCRCGGRGRGMSVITTPPHPACRREAVGCALFENKRQETCVSMAEKAKVCLPGYGKSAKPAENHLSVPRFTRVPIVNVAPGGTMTPRRHVIWGISV